MSTHKNHEVFMRAVWNPLASLMEVRFHAAGHQHIEMMTADRYRRFCADLDSKMEIADWKIVFTPGSDRNEIKAIRDYFRQVLQSMEDFFGKQ